MYSCEKVCLDCVDVQLSTTVDPLIMPLIDPPTSHVDA